MTETQRRVAAVWAQILQLPRVDPHAHFLDLGGHSLKAMRIISRLQEFFGLELPADKVFQCPTVARLAALIDSLRLDMPQAAPTVSPEQIPNERRVHRYFEHQAAATPDAPAVRFGDAHLSYQELNQQANRLAHALIRQGVKADAPVGLFVDRSASLAVAVLGVLKAGGAYVPLDRAYPSERLAWMLENSRAPIIVTQHRHIQELPPHQAQVVCLDELPASPIAGNPAVDESLDPLAYVIYTSGSTGRPKGVAMSHRPLVNLVHWQKSVLPLEAGAPVVQFAPISFDVSFQEMFTTWAQGGCLHFITGQTRLDPRLLGRYIDDHAIQRLFLPFVALRQFAESAADLAMPSLKRIITAGEQLIITDSVRAFFASHPGCRLHNHYGPTETHVVTSHDLSDDPARWPALPPIGRPVWNTQILLLDDSKFPVLPGQTGEIYVGGDALARGYLHQPDLSAQRFISDPATGRRLYKTGDLARLNAEGELEFLGRADDQIKFRGYRIETGEIEAVLGGHPKVRQAVVILREDRPGDKRLAAYLVSDEDHARIVPEVRELIARRLPEYMAPQSYVVLDKLPATPSGKVDRRALPPPSPHTDDNLDAASPERMTPIQSALASIWAKVLGVARVGLTDDLFDLGAHSLMAAKAAWMIRRELGVEIPLSGIFEHPNVAAMAELAAKGEIRPHPERLAAPAEQFDLVVPMSFAQQRLWFLNQFETDPAVYNICLEVRFQGPLNPRHLEFALNHVVQRHQPLRTTFDIQDGQPVQRIQLLTKIPLAVDDLRSQSDLQRDRDLDLIKQAEARRPFNLRAGPLLRARLVRLSDQQNILILGMHHIISDGWSMGLLLQEIAECYRAACRRVAPNLPQLPMHYAQYAQLQRNWLQSGPMKRQLEYWRKHLTGAPESLELFTDHPRPAQRAYAGDCRTLAWPSELAKTIQIAARQRGMTLFMAILAVYAEFLRRYSGQDHVVVGSPMANRTRPEIEHLIGFFVNSLPLHMDLSGDPTVNELLERVRAAALGAYGNQDVPFEKLVQELRPRRIPNRSPLFQAMFVLQNTPQLNLDLPGLSVQMRYILSNTAKYDLLLSVEQVGQALEFGLEFSVELFDGATIERMLENLRSLAQAMFADPQKRLSELAMGHQAERQMTVDLWNRTGREYPRDASIHQVFTRIAAARPREIALVFGDERWSYRKLEEYANRLAHRLIDMGVKTGDPVAIALERGPELIGGILAILKAGGCYVPLDPAYPDERLNFMLLDSAASALVTRDTLACRFAASVKNILSVDSQGDLIGGAPATDPAVHVPPLNPAYIIYTSGSTGNPKGVVVPHRAVLRLVFGCDYATFSPDRIFLQLAPVSFDASTFEIWGALLHGARCVIAPPGLPSMQQIGRLIQEQQVTTAWLTSSLFNAMIDQFPQALASLSELLIGGEALSVPHVHKAMGLLPRTQIVNGYGPTESATFACCHRIPRTVDPRQASIPIGKPIGNTRIYILDERLNPLSIGATGHLHIGGDGLALGYLNNPELTAGKFITDPFSADPNDRLYRTGDLARWRGDGTIEFIGRIDQQVKLRGFRIEPGEIEAVIALHPAVRQSVVMVREDSPGDKRLVAYVVCAADVPPAMIDDLKKLLHSRLPHYMIPQAIVMMPALPLTANGKTDRAALPAPQAAGHPVNDGFIAPDNELESRIAAIFSALLHVPGVSMTDDFFELGGHSLAAVNLSSAIEKEFKIMVPLQTVFNAPTVRKLAMAIERLKSGATCERIIPLRAEGTQHPLFFIPGVGGHAGSLRELAVRMGEDQPVYGLQPNGLDGVSEPDKSIEEMAAGFIRIIAQMDPVGPYSLAGFSAGGLVAWEIARQLAESGRKTAFLALLDTHGPGYPRLAPLPIRVLGHLKTALKQGPIHALEYVRKRIFYRLGRMAWIRRYAPIPLPDTGGTLSAAIRTVAMTWVDAIKRYPFRPMRQKVYLFQAKQIAQRIGATHDDPMMGWGKLALGGVEVRQVPGSHSLIVRPPYVDHLAAEMKAALRQAKQEAGS